MTGIATIIATIIIGGAVGAATLFGLVNARPVHPASLRPTSTRPPSTTAPESRRVLLTRPPPGRPGRSVRLSGSSVRAARSGPLLHRAAADSAAQLGSSPRCAGPLLDVGGGPGFFREAFRRRGATYFALDADVGGLSGRGEIGRGDVIGGRMACRSPTAAVDICYSSNVLEHVPDPGGCRRDGAGDRPGRHRLPQLHVGRDRGAVTRRRRGTSSAASGPGGGTAGGRGTRPRTATASPCSRSPSRGLAWAAARAGGGRRGAPAILPALVVVVLRVPALREVVTWNLVVVLRKGSPRPVTSGSQMR